jgi:DNA-binding transcriptional LysR family regulator
LNFGRAAARLNMTQPPLSQQIQRLEEELSVKLFHRTKRQVQLTDSGRILVREGRRILAQTEQAVRLTVKASRGEIGLLRLGYLSSADSIVAEILKAFARRTPNVNFELHRMSTVAQLQALHTGRIQTGFLRLPVSDPKVIIEPIFKEPLIVALPQGHRLAARKRLPLTALSREHLVLVSRSSDLSLHDSIVAACMKAGFNPNVICETNDAYAGLALVAAGLGISLLPASIRHVQRSGIVLRFLQPPVPQTEIAVAYLHDNPSELLHLFLCVLQDVAAPKLAAS